MYVQLQMLCTVLVALAGVFELANAPADYWRARISSQYTSEAADKERIRGARTARRTPGSSGTPAITTL